MFAAPTAFAACSLLAYGVALRFGPLRPPPTPEERPEDDGAAAAPRVAGAGFVAGAFAIVGSIAGPLADRGEGAAPLGTAAALAAFALPTWLAVEALLSRTLHRALGALVARGVLAAGLARAAHALAAGLLVGAALPSPVAFAPKDAALAGAFLAVGLVALLVTIVLFRALTRYDDSSQIASGNGAAALSYGALAVAVALAIADAISGEAGTVTEASLGFAEAFAPALLFAPLRQLGVQTLLLGGPLRLRGGRLDDAIGGERSLGAAALEGATYLGVALLARAL